MFAKLIIAFFIKVCYNIGKSFICLRCLINRSGGFILSNMLYNQEIEDELMIQFIILYALNNADEIVEDIIKNNLKVIDLTAASICYEQKIPVIIFGLNEENSIIRAVNGDKIGTVVTV